MDPSARPAAVRSELDRGCSVPTRRCGGGCQAVRVVGVPAEIAEPGQQVRQQPAASQRARRPRCAAQLIEHLLDAVVDLGVVERVVMVEVNAVQGRIY